MNYTAEILALRADEEPFKQALLDLFIFSVGRNDAGLAEALSELQLEGSATDPILPDDATWNRLKACTPNAERTTWAKAMYLALEAGDLATAERLQELVVRRTAN